MPLLILSENGPIPNKSEIDTIRYMCILPLYLQSFPTHFAQTGTILRIRSRSEECHGQSLRGFAPSPCPPNAYIGALFLFSSKFPNASLSFIILVIQIFECLASIYEHSLCVARFHHRKRRSTSCGINVTEALQHDVGYDVSQAGLILNLRMI